jgi:predicted ATPase/DNA-binding SARP family transcriptional activator/tetratricopeptide (TPR) repeat protein
MTLRVLLFGAPSIEHDGALTVLPFERGTQLLALLAHRATWLARHELAALLWPEHERALALTNLRKAVFRLQQRPWGGALETQGASVRVVAATDVAAFDDALRDGRTNDALALRRGEWLHGFDDDTNGPWTEWLRFERDRLRASWRGAALERLADDDAGLDAAAGIELVTRLLDADPLDEAALAALLPRLAQSGQAARARQLYAAFAARLADELGIEPGAPLQALHAGLTADAAPRAAPAAALLAAGDGGFVGRGAERQHLAALLQRDDTRLLSLVGPGGVGKTRLALRVLLELAPAFANDAAFVALDDVSAAPEVAVRIARELGLALQGRTPPLAQVAAALKARRTLLVLDNVEQIDGIAAPLRTLLDDCPGLKLLVTSRVRLGLADEQLVVLDGLPCPEPEDRDRLDAFDATRLFITAARRVDPALQPAAEAAAIVEICRRVEGLPLAIELAAAWTRVLSCDAIAAELRRGSDLLRATDAAHPERHASIDVVFEQSWRYLAAAERDALARLAQFRGGFTVEAARAVTGVALPVVGALIDKSLLRKDGLRLVFHPLVQQWVAARPDAAAVQQVRAAHAAWFHRQLAHWKDASARGDRATLQAIDAEFENLRLAWQFAIDAGQADALRQSAATLFEYVDHRARFDDGAALCAQVLASPLAAREPALRALMQAQAAWLQARLGRYDAATAQATDALALAVASRARDARFQALSALGSCALFTGHPAEAKRRFGQALRQARAAGLSHESATVFENLSLAEKHLGDYDAALSHALDALAQHRRNGDVASAALCLSNLGSTTMFLGDLDAAARHLTESLALVERHGLVSTRVYVLGNLTELALKTGDRAAAGAHAERALETAQATGMHALAGWLQVQLARLAVHRGELAAAREGLSAATALAIELNARGVQAVALLGLAEVLEAQGHAAAGRRVLGFAAEADALGAPDRDELRTEWARRVASAPAPDPPWPGPALPALLQRIVAEAPQGYAPLVAEIGG